MKIKAIALAVTTSLCAFDSVAADVNFYAVGSIGSAKYDIGDDKDIHKEIASYYNSFAGVTASAKSDDKDVVYSVGGGAKLSQYAAVELFYRDYGKATSGYSATDGFDFEEEKVELTASGLGVGVVGFLPVADRFSLFGRLDLVNLKAEAKYAYGERGYAESGKTDDTNLVLGFGVGAQYDFTDQFSARLDFQRIEVELKDYEEDIDSFNLSLVVNF